MRVINDSMTQSIDEVFFQYSDPSAIERNTYLLTFYHVLLVITVIVTVCGSVVDIKTMDWGVVVTGWNILHGMESRHVHSASEQSPK